MLEDFSSSVALDLNQLMKTYQDDLTGERLKRAIEALNQAAEVALTHWSSTADPLARNQSMSIHDGLRAAADIVSDLAAQPH